MLDNRSNILNCALELFAARGYDGVGVLEVAEAAGITKPTLYHYFGSKLGLLKALFETYHTPLNAAVAQAAHYQGDLPHSLTALAQVYFDYARRHPVYYRLQLALYFAPRHSEANSVSASWNFQQHQSIEAMFTAAEQHHGNMRGRHALYAATWVGALNTCIGMWLNGYIELDDELLQRVVRQFQYGIYS